VTSIGSIISPTLAAAMRDAVAMNKADEPDEVRVTVINGVEYDVRSEAMAQTTCADCSANLLVEVAPSGADLDLLISKPRTAVCTDCGRKRVAGKRGTVIHAQEGPTLEIDLSKFSEAQLKQLAVEAREHMRQEKAAEIPAKRKKSKKAEAERIAQDDVLKTKARKERKALVLPALSIPVKGQVKEIPALDLSDEGLDLNIATTPKQRSPYNKALYAMGRDLLDTKSTLVDLAKTHQDLMEHSGEPAVVAKPKKKAKKAKAEKVKTEVVVAQIEPESKAKTDRAAKIEAMVEITGWSKKKARKHLEMVGVL
jgi:DNA-directed RNA polymerase subunit RPC12/RpoP